MVTVTIKYRGFDVAVEGEFMPEERGSREKGSGVQLEPDLPAYFEMERAVIVVNEHVNEQLLIHEEDWVEMEELACAKCLETIANDYGDYEGD